MEGRRPTNTVTAPLTVQTPASVTATGLGTDPPTVVVGTSFSLTLDLTNGGTAPANVTDVSLVGVTCTAPAFPVLGVVGTRTITWTGCASPRQHGSGPGLRDGDLGGRQRPREPGDERPLHRDDPGPVNRPDPFPFPFRCDTHDLPVGKHRSGGRHGRKARRRVEALGSREAPQAHAGRGLHGRPPVYSREELQQILAERESWTAGELAETIARSPVARRASRPTRAFPSPTSSIRPAVPRRTTGGTSATRAVTPSPAVSSPRCTGGACGRCGSSPASAPPRTRTQRFKYLLAHGMTGLSTAFDMPALMGYDADHPMSLGEVGKEGVAISTLEGLRDPLRRHPARRGHHLDDHQRERGRRAGHVRRRRRRSRASRGPGSAAPSRTTC